MEVARALGRFLWLHKLELLLAPLYAFTAATLLHELGHAALVWLQGGIVQELTFLPGPSDLGHIRYALPVDGLDWLVAAGPTAMWTACMLLTAAALAIFSNGAGGFFTRNVYAWGYVVPLGDITWHAVPWVMGGTNDLTHALGPADGLDAAAVAVLTAGAFVLGYLIMRRSYGPRSLSKGAYALVALAALVLLSAAALL